MLHQHWCTAALRKTSVKSNKSEAFLMDWQAIEEPISGPRFDQAGLLASASSKTHPGIGGPYSPLRRAADICNASVGVPWKVPQQPVSRVSTCPRPRPRAPSNLGYRPKGPRFPDGPDSRSTGLIHIN